MNIRLSPSSVDVFKTCKLKFKLAKIDMVQPLVKGTIYTALGSAIHNSIKSYIDLKGTDFTTLSGIFSNNLNDSLNHIGLSSTAAKDTLFETGNKMLQNYIEKDKREGLLAKIIESERKHEIARTGYTIVGVIDVIYKSDEFVHVQDYKTSQRVKTQEEVDKDYQLSSYAWIYRQVYGRLPTHLSLYFIRHDTEVITQRTEADLIKFEKYTDGVYQKIVDEKEWAPNLKACYNCEYIHNCPAHTKIRIV